MENSIGHGAIKIACIQTAPGFEFQVKSRLEDACEKDSEIIDFIIFKGVGNFDIILVYWTNEFGAHLGKAGPIKHILKSNLLLCYPYLRKDAKEIFVLLKKKVFTSFSLLKISPGLKKVHPEIDNLLREFVPRIEDNWSLLGSLGWNELIVMISDDDLVRITQNLYTLGSVFLPSGKDLYPAILKTLSIVGINYHFLPRATEVKKGFKQAKLVLEKTPSFANLLIHPQKSDVRLTVEITAKVCFGHEIEKYFRSKGFKPSLAVGKRDIVLRPIRQDMTCAHLLASLLDFRFKFKKKIFATNTRIVFDKDQPGAFKPKDLNVSIPIFDFDYSELEEAFGETMGSSLANQFYTLNSLFQNPLCGTVYADMAKYPSYVRDVGKAYKAAALESDGLHFAQRARDVIRAGAELRSYGTYETIEEVTGRFSEYRGGCQLSLLAMEFLPSYILENLNIQWAGFVVAADPKFVHINEVINVPTEAVWKPDRWWALYHEIGHIIVDNKPGELVAEDIQPIEQFLENRDRSILELLIELAAEIIGFELGFFGNYDMFFRLLWMHLAEDVDPYQTLHVPISDYAIRSFFVELFLGHFRKNTTVAWVSKDEYTNLDVLFEKFVSHMEGIERLIKKPMFPDKHFVAAENVKMLKDLYPTAQYWSKKMLEFRLRPHKRVLQHKNTEDVVTSLKSGRIWWDNIRYPEGVLFKLFSEPGLDFNARIATILSLWNQQMLRYSKRFT